jgi:hypothetical protein
MIWTITLWLAMQGCFAIDDHMFCNSVEIHEAKLGRCKAPTDGPETATLGVPPCWETPLEPSVGFLLSPRADHVFEIKTKREPTGQTIVCSYISLSGNPSCRTIPTPKYCPDGNYCKEIVNVTRELWMDGKRLGTIEGLD